KAGIHSPSIGYNFFPCTLLEGEDLVKEEIDKLIDSTEPNDTKEEMNEPDSSSTIVDIEVEVNHETPEPPRPKRLRCKFYVDDGQVRENHSPSASAKKLMWARWGFAQYGFPSEGVKTPGNFHISREIIAGLWERYLWDPEVDAIAQTFPELQSNEENAFGE
ncbi:hypothetical protein FOZ63_008442, partial [Perkinsus olseni]